MPKTKKSVRIDYHRQPWLSYDEAALVSGLERSTLRCLASQGRLGNKRERGLYRISHEGLNKYLEGTG